ncbi:MAG: hypothetical protein ABF295_07365 [Flavobacteriaceae bacterium]
MKSLNSLIVIFILWGSGLFAQETNYWFHNFGALSTIRGGIETAGVRNTSAAFYNPGALAFIEGEFLEGQADVVTIDAIDIKDAGGDGIDISSFTVNIQPSMLAYMRRLKKNPRIVYSVGGLSRYDFNNAFQMNYEQLGNYLSPPDRTDVFQGQFRYNNRTRENWIIGAVGYRLSDRVGIGLAGNIFVKTTDFSQSYTANAFPEDELIGNPETFVDLASQAVQERLDYRALGFIFKPAANFDFDALKLGITVSLPAINLGLLNNFAEKSQLSIRPDQIVDIINVGDGKKSYAGVYKTPLSINIGGHYDFGKFDLAVSAEWFSKIDRYNMIKEKNNSEDLQFPPSSDPNFAIPVLANRSVFNIGISWQAEVRENFDYYGSLRTDHSFFDQDVVNTSMDFTPIATTWDIYHFTSGIQYSGPRADLTLGFNYGHGRQDDYQQFVDMTGASQENFLNGEPDAISRARYNNFSITLGFNFNVDWKKGLETDDI